MNKSAAWEARRRQIVARCPGCSYCGAEDRQIHVHHRYYEAGKQQWEYPDESLVPLCPSCHGRADQLRRNMVRATGVLEDNCAEQALGYMRALFAQDQLPEEALIEFPPSAEFCEGVGHVFGLSERDVQFIVQRRTHVSAREFAAASPLRRHQDWSFR